MNIESIVQNMSAVTSVAVSIFAIWFLYQVAVDFRKKTGKKHKAKREMELKKAVFAAVDWTQAEIITMYNHTDLINMPLDFSARVEEDLSNLWKQG